VVCFALHMCGHFVALLRYGVVGVDEVAALHAFTAAPRAMDTSAAEELSL
jgi:hypothetical protein